MKLCAAQIKPLKGDVEANIEKHINFIELAVSYGADTIIFPELSLTGYEPDLAKELATTINDSRFDIFQTISNTNKITIGAGMPVKNNRGITISMMLFHPHQPRQLYSKKYLHADEEPFFVSGENETVVMNTKTNIALAICYEVFVPQHLEDAFTHGAKIYIASVAKSAKGVDKAIVTLPAIASKYGMTILMCNCVGYCDNFESAGRSSAWNDKGILIGQLNNKDEGLLMIDTDTQEIIEEII